MPAPQVSFGLVPGARRDVDRLVTGQVISTNPAASVRGPAHSVRRGKTPVLALAEARRLLDAIDVTTPGGLRDRGLIGLMVYSFALVGAALAMRVEDVVIQNGGSPRQLRQVKRGILQPEFAQAMIRPALLASAIARLMFASVATAAAPPFETPAPIAYMIDLSSGAELLAKDADRRMPPASLAKMMETELAFELIDKGQLSLGKMCTVQPETWQKWHGAAAGSTMFLSPGEQVSVENLLHGIVTLSGNDAAIVLAECVAGTAQAFVAQENVLARTIGITNSYFGTPNGWPDNDVTMVTARDLARLARASIERHPKLYKQFYAQPNFTWGKTLGAGADITQENRNPLLGRVAGADGLKTGHTEEAGYGFTGSAEQNGRRLIIVLAGMASKSQRIEESVRFMNWGFNAWQTKPLYRSGAKVGSARVQGGSASEVSLVAPRDIAITMPAGLGGTIKSTLIRNAGLAKAPINKGDHIADLVVTTDSGPQISALVAGEFVEEAGFFRRIWIRFEQMLGLA